MSARISRRMVLRGLGTAVALPWLEAMSPSSLAAAKAGKPPLRMAFLYVPNGINMAQWTPEQDTGAFALPSSLEPLESFREHLMVLTGLTQDNARAKGDGGGDHARALASFLTGCHPRKTDGADIQAGVSVDQVAAQRIGRATRFPSLELGIEGGRQAGNCDSGYSCAYSSNISWRSPSTPVPKEINPRLVFERLFGGDNPNETSAARAKRQKTRRSILDFVREDAQSLSNQLGANDRRKLDEYLSSVRELEVRVSHDGSGKAEGPAGMERPKGIPRELAEHHAMMSDLLTLAFQGDLTRVSTFVYANEGSNRSYPFLGVPEGHHELSHHGKDPDKLDKLAKINRFHIEQFAYFLGKLQAVQEGEGTLLDNMMIVYGSGIGDGNRHNHDDLPVLLAGKGRGTLTTGRHVRYPGETPLNNLFLSMLDRMDSSVEELGDSNGRLPNLQS